MLEVRSSSVERLSNDLHLLHTPDEEDDGSNIEGPDVDVEKILARARENVYQSRRFHHQAPDFVKRLTPFNECKVKESVRFECVCQSFPLATIRWFHDADEINEDDLRERFKVEQLDNGTNRLTLIVASKADEGTFKCMAINDEGSTSTIGYLSVTGARRKSRGKYSNDDQNRKKRSVSSSPDLRTITEQRAKEEEETLKDSGDVKITETTNDIRMTSSMIVQSFGEMAKTQKEHHTDHHKDHKKEHTRRRERAPERHRLPPNGHGKESHKKDNTTDKDDSKFLKPLPDTYFCHSDSEITDHNVRLTPIRKVFKTVASINLLRRSDAPTLWKSWTSK